MKLHLIVFQKTYHGTHLFQWLGRTFAHLGSRSFCVCNARSISADIWKSNPLEDECLRLSSHRCHGFHSCISAFDTGHFVTTGRHRLRTFNKLAVCCHLVKCPLALGTENRDRRTNSSYSPRSSVVPCNAKRSCNGDWAYGLCQKSRFVRISGGYCSCAGNWRHVHSHLALMLKRWPNSTYS